ncbi:MAG: exo-alpha-sialidase [Spirochaetales bacterium]|nr:exo-alpha-sialidase [Spirochaetales bacterium]
MKARCCIRGSSRHPSCHAPSICELPGGDLLACCFAGQSLEGSPDQIILGSRFDSASGRWSRSRVWVDVPNRAAGNPRVFRAPGDGEIWLLAPITYGQWCSGGTRLFMKRSYDGGRTWKDLELLIEEKGILGKNKPLIEGPFCLIPVEEEHLWNPKFLRSEDAGATWELVGNLGRDAGARLIQPAVVRLRDGRLMAYMRSQENHIFVSYSADDGRRWTRPEPTPLPNNNSGIDLARLESGNLVLAYNPTTLSNSEDQRDPGLPFGSMAGFDTWGPRTPLELALSTDEGQSWSRRLVLEDGPGVFCYPAVIQASDGRIHVVYTYNREAIRHVTVTEAELLTGTASAQRRPEHPTRT